MTTVATCSNPAEAMLLKSVLEANGITAYVPDELTAQASPVFSATGIHIKVEDEHAAEARRLLAEAEQAFATEEEKGEDEDESR
jgi:hypothetical protein